MTDRKGDRIGIVTGGEYDATNKSIVDLSIQIEDAVKSGASATKIQKLREKLNTQMGEQRNIASDKAQDAANQG